MSNQTQRQTLHLFVIVKLRHEKIRPFSCKPTAEEQKTYHSEMYPTNDYWSAHRHPESFTRFDSQRQRAAGRREKLAGQGTRSKSKTWTPGIGQGSNPRPTSVLASPLACVPELLQLSY